MKQIPKAFRKVTKQEFIRLMNSKNDASLPLLEKQKRNWSLLDHESSPKENQKIYRW